MSDVMECPVGTADGKRRRRPHRVLVIGAGSIGERHVRCFGATERAEVVLAETNEQLRRTVARRYGLRASYADFIEVLGGEGIDAAVIATPAPLHVPMARTLVEAGVSVLIEKPLSVAPHGVRELQAEAADRGVVGSVAYVLRAHPALAGMRQAVRSGQFGKPLEVVAVCGQHFPTFRPAFRQTYYARRSTGGGAIQDALTHIINAVEWIIGPTDRVIADADRKVLDGVEVEDTVHVLARNGAVMASYSLNQHQAPNESTITIACERGTVRFEAHHARWRWMDEPGQPWRDGSGGPVERDALFIAQAAQFLDVVEGRAEPLCSIGEGAQTLAVNRAALASLELRCWQTVETF